MPEQFTLFDTVMQRSIQTIGVVLAIAVLGIILYARLSVSPLLLIFPPVAAIIAALMAAKKGLTPIWWAYCGALFGLLALVVLAFRKGVETAHIEAAASGAGAIAFRECPFCAELIDREAFSCRYCGSTLTAPTRKTNTAGTNTART